MQVWNKNRPAPPPSTKHLTDEELKQQYGIHMTSRIEADGESKEAKWADIDDDEDDWAPETIEWADGTKVTLNHASNMPLAQEALKVEQQAGVQPNESQPTRSKPPQTISSVGPNATVLKLGANAERQQAQKATILQKGPSEKASPLTAKSSAAPPAKSPWAPLPPVDKLSPIVINPQIPMPQQSQYAQMPPGGPSQSMGLAHSPAKEISADDFNRSWRDSQPGQPRELYMPSSGRYEAVNERQRRSSRNDQNFRAPALLQRPTHNDQHAPAEPSPAFQTNRVSADQERAPWNRRRASSIQSGGSGQFGRRMSITKGVDVPQMPNDIPQQHRGSSQLGAVDAATSFRGVHVQQQPPQLPSTAGPAGQSFDPTQGPDQRRLMQEAARLAVRRRQEEEEKEDAARKERIRIKLEQLGPPPEQKTKVPEQKVEAVPKADESAPPVLPLPKPPIPEPSGEPQQYGMMKVYHPDNVKKLTPPSEKPEVLSDIKSPEVEAQPQVEAVMTPSPIVNGVRPTSEVTSSRPLEESQEIQIPTDDQAQPWKNISATPEPLPGWHSRQSHAGAAPGNLWGPPNHDKALGNGTFDQRLTGLSARDISMRNSAQQQKWLNGKPLPQDRPQVSAMRPASQENAQSTASFPSPEQRPIAANSEVDSMQPVGKPLPIGPPQAQALHQRWQQTANPRPANNGVAAWNNFHAVAAREDREQNERFQHDLAASLEEEARTGIRRAPQYIFNETWKQVEISDQAGDRQVTSVARGNITPSFSSTHPYGASAPNLNGDRAANGLPIRGSRFFPTEGRRAVTYSHPEVPRSPSPPPAEELGSFHPAYDGDSKRPVISFPVPKVVVNLPKPQQKPSPLPAPPTQPRTFAAAASQPPPTMPSPLRSVSGPIAARPDWQHRFNDLLGRKSPPKKQVLAVAPSSREPLDVVPPNFSAAVSLPPKELDLLKDAGKVTSKDVEEEEDLFEDREAGSLPLVQIPRDIPENLWHPARTPQLRPKGRFFRPEIDPISMPSYDGDDPARGFKGKDIVFFLRLPGSTKSIKKTVPRKATSNNGFVRKGSKNHTFTTNNTKHNKSGHPKSRESSGSFPNAQQQQGGKGNGNGNGSMRQPPPPQANGNIPNPRAGFPGHHQNEWRGGHVASAGVAH
jgi:hypothetical protein